MRVMLLTRPNTYRAEAFLQAADQLGIAVARAVDVPEQLVISCGDQLGMRFQDLTASTRAICNYAAQQPLAAVLAIDDGGSLLAAQASAALNLPHNSIDAATAARDKFVMRELLARSQVPIPQYRLYSSHDDLAAIAGELAYPCVVKPTELNGSRGVMRADNSDAFVVAAQRLIRLLQREYGTSEPQPFLVEEFIPGFEVALEGLLDDGKLQVLALFDKPDPVDGPFFEETLYVTPSRLPAATQQAIFDCAAQAAAAIGLRRGPMHAELRVNQRGSWLVEVAGRSIGGLCSKTLRFGTSASLEELILRQACGLPIDSLQRAGQAGGVMMIPIPAAGVLRRIDGIDAARAVPGIESVEITAKLNYPLVPLPEGASYLGFIFANGSDPAGVEAALRGAHACLHFHITPSIDLSR
jgi:biotin carboxylase